MNVVIFTMDSCISHCSSSAYPCVTVRSVGHIFCTKSAALSQVSRTSVGWSCAWRSSGTTIAWSMPWPREPRTCCDCWVQERSRIRKPLPRSENTQGRPSVASEIVNPFRFSRLSGYLHDCVQSFCFPKPQIKLREPT